MRHVFREHKLLAPVGDAAAINDHKIVPEWPIPTKPSLRADLALKNGIMRVAKVCDLAIGEADPLPPGVFTSVVTLEVAGKEAEAEKRFFAYRAQGPRGRVDEMCIRDRRSAICGFPCCRRYELLKRSRDEAVFEIDDGLGIQRRGDK